MSLIATTVGTAESTMVASSLYENVVLGEIPCAKISNNKRHDDVRDLEAFSRGLGTIRTHSFYVV